LGSEDDGVALISMSTDHRRRRTGAPKRGELGRVDTERIEGVAEGGDVARLRRHPATT
jgi:hypothetical protein